MIILAIDPGLAETGWAVLSAGRGANGAEIVECGFVKTTNRRELTGRLMIVYNCLDTIIKKFEPDIVCIEKQFLFNNSTTVLATSQARGVILLAAAMNKKKVAEYNPRDVKKAVTGSGSAGKEQVRRMVKRILGIKSLSGPHDVSDAMAVGICHINSLQRYDSYA